jgi:uncharacterized membrane-anchored protein
MYRRLTMDNKKPRIGVIIFAALYIVIGLGNLVTGASTDSRFYVFDNILVRIIGALLVISGIGLLFRKEIARKGIIAALALGIIEIFIGIPTSFNIFEFRT